MEESYTIKRFSFKRSEIRNEVTFLVTAFERGDKAVARVTFYDDKERPFKLVVMEHAIVEVYHYTATTPEIYEEKDIEKLYYPKKLPEIVKQIYDEAKQLADLLQRKKKDSLYRFSLQMNLLKPQHTWFHKTVTLKGWKPSLNSCLVEPLYVLSGDKIVVSNLVLDAADPQKGAQDVISYLVALLQCFDIQDAEQMMQLNNAFYDLIHQLQCSSFEYNKEVFQAPKFDIVLTVTRNQKIQEE